MNAASTLRTKINKKTAVVGVVGIGYVGDALAEGCSKVGFKTIGFTRTPKRADNVNKRNNPQYIATTDTTLLSECDIFCICVPTPVHEDKRPDLRPLEEAVSLVTKYIKKGSLVIIESTIAPGTTRAVGASLLKKEDLKEESDYFLSFSPERVDPGNKKYGIHNTPRVVSGLSEVSTELVTLFYRSFVETVIPVSSLEAAEMSKILENTFRLVNISLMNELLPYAESLNVDLWEVINASSSKPYGFLPHYPGPGIGGHCIPVDPYYLIADARSRNISLGIVERAGYVNEEQPQKVVNRTLDIIHKTNGKKLNHSALLIGLAYKQDIEDRRESPSLRIWELLEKEHVDVSYHDPYIPALNTKESLPISKNSINDKDIIIIATPHSSVDYPGLLLYKKPILDTRNVLKGYSSPYIYRI